MRLFTLISLWLCWLICAFYALANLLFRFQGRIAHDSSDKSTNFTYQMWLAYVIMLGVALCPYLLRRHFWFVKSQAVGFGYWAVTMVFYTLFLFSIAFGCAPTFIESLRSLAWPGAFVGIVWLIIAFPKLPAPPPAA